MAIAFGAQAVNASPTTLATTHTASLTLSTGDLVTVLISCRDNVTVSSVVGSVNGAYTQAGSAQVSVPLSNAFAAIYYFANAASGSETITVTFSANGRAAVNAARWTGGATSSALDQNNGQNNASGTAHSHASITSTGAGLIITSAHLSGDPGATTQTGFTALTRATGFTRDWFGYRIVSGATTEDGDFTSTNSVASAGKIASFNEAGGGVSIPVFSATYLRQWNN